MKKVKSKNEKVQNDLKKVDKKSKEINSNDDKKEQALKAALAAKTKQLKKNPEAIDKKQLKNKKKELLESMKKEKEASQNSDANKITKKKEKQKSMETIPEKSSQKPDDKKEASKLKKKEKKAKKLENKKAEQEGLEEKTSEVSNENNKSLKLKKKQKKAKKLEHEKSETAKEESPSKSPEKKKKSKKSKKANANSTEEKEKKPSDPECTVFVGNLPQNIKKQQLITLFKTYGNVISVRLRTALGNTLFKHKSRKETECLNAYVVLDTPENAEKALELSGTEFHGRHIRVTKSLKGTLINEDSCKRSVFVGNLKYKVTEDTLYELFSSCGEIEAVRTMKNDKGCKGTGYVIFKSKEGVQLAQDLNETLVFGRPVRVERYSVKKTQEKPASNPKLEKNEKGKSKKNKVKDGNKKKGDFRGVKTAIKKKKLNKKKKLGGNPFQKKLAQKIAPKEV